MARVEVDVTVKADAARVWIDGTRVALTDGSGRAAVTPGSNHAMSWAVRGAPGTSYTVRITSPSEARFTHTDRFDDEQFDAGLTWFKVLTAVCLALMTGRAVAQPAAASVARMAGASRLTKQSAAAPASAIDLAPVFALEGSTAATTATGQIGFLLGDLGLALGASAPFGGTGAATFADFDGLRSKSSASADIAWHHWSVRDVAPQLDAACTAAGRAKGCSLLDLKRDDSPEGRIAFKRALETIDPGTLLFAGAAGRIAPERFEYVSGANLSVHADRRTSWSASATAGALFGSGLSLTASYTRERAYQAQSQVQLCTPGPAPAWLICGDEILGGPGAPSNTNRVSMEARRVFRWFGISPKVTYDATRGATGVQLPLYFLQDPAGGLRGGIILGWRSDRKEFSARAVVGQVLGLITK